MDYFYPVKERVLVPFVTQGNFRTWFPAVATPASITQWAILCRTRHDAQVKLFGILRRKFGFSLNSLRGL